jgi:hypothetical protein
VRAVLVDPGAGWGGIALKVLGETHVETAFPQIAHGENAKL